MSVMVQWGPGLIGNEITLDPQYLDANPFGQGIQLLVCMFTRFHSIPLNLMLSAGCTVLHWANQFATHIGFRTILGL